MEQLPDTYDTFVASRAPGPIRLLKDKIRRLGITAKHSPEYCILNYLILALKFLVMIINSHGPYNPAIVFVYYYTIQV